MGFVYLFFSLGCGIASQLLMKWQLGRILERHIMPDNFLGKINYLFLYILFNKYIILSFLLTFFAGCFWMGTLAKFPLSFAYPFTIVPFVLILFFSYFFFNESLSIYKILGSIFIFIGIIIICQEKL